MDIRQAVGDFVQVPVTADADQNIVPFSTHPGHLSGMTRPLGLKQKALQSGFFQYSPGPFGLIEGPYSSGDGVGPNGRRLIIALKKFSSDVTDTLFFSLFAEFFPDLLNQRAAFFP